MLISDKGKNSEAKNKAFDNIVREVTDSVEQKIFKGMKREEGKVFLHTGPHHDDIMLGILPYVNKQLYSPSNKSVFAVLTSGFTSVTNSFLKSILENTLNLISSGRIEMIYYSDFFAEGYKHKRYKDIYSYLNSLGLRSDQE